MRSANWASTGYRPASLCGVGNRDVRSLGSSSRRISNVIHHKSDWKAVGKDVSWDDGYAFAEAICAAVLG